MKDSRIFKVRSVIITAIVLVALLITAATVAILAASANNVDADDTALGVTFAGHQVNLGGTLELRFLYSDLGAATHVVTEVHNTNTNQVESAEISVDDLATLNIGDETYKVVSVEIPAARITDTVTVYPKNGNNIGVKRTKSIPEYANEALASDNYSNYHDALKAILNYGAMAQKHFGVNTANLANEGLYTNGNPATPYNSLATDLGITSTASWTDGTTLKHGAYEAVLTGSTSLRLYFEYTGEGSLTATVSRDAVGSSAAVTNRAIEIKGAGRANTYYAEITGISAKLYATAYTLTVTDGSETMTYTASILDYVKSVLSAIGPDGVAYSQRSTVVAMYRMYAWISGNTPDTDTCAHTRTHYEKLNETTSVAICSACGKQLENEMPLSTNMYLDANYLGPLVNGDGLYNMTADGLGTDSDGTTYYKYGGKNTVGQLFWTRIGKDGSGNQYPQCQLNPIEVSGGKYLVLKMKVNDAKQATTELRFGTILGDAVYDETYSSRMADKTLDIPIDNGAVGTWQTYVVDITNSKWSSAWKQNEDGTYTISYLQLTFYGSPASEKTIDLAYFALVDDWTELKAINGNGNVKYVYESGKATDFTADGSCVKHAWKETSNATAFTVACSVCGTTQTVDIPNGVNKFITPGTIAATGHYGVTSTSYAVENGVPYTHIVMNGSASHINIWSASGGGGSAKALGANSGRYIIVKYRLKNADNFNFEASTGGLGVNNINYTEAKAKINCSDWQIMMVDASQFKNYQTNTDGLTAQIRWTVNNYNQPAGTYRELDIAYVAIVDGYAKQAVADGEYVRLFNAENIDGIKLNADCASNDARHNVVTEKATSDDTTTYSYHCAWCGKDMGSKSVPDSVNVFISAIDIKKGSVSSNLSNNDYAVMNENGEMFLRIDGDISDAMKVNNNVYISFSGYQNSSGSVETGRYLVLKYRIGKNGLGQEKLMFYTGTEATSATGEHQNLTIGVSEDNEWHIAVIDIKAFMDAKTDSGYKAADDGKYYAKFLDIRPFSGVISSGSGENRVIYSDENDYTDIAYMAFCNELSDIAVLVGVNSVDFYTEQSGYTGDPATGECVGAHVKATETISTNESDDTVLTYTCARCGYSTTKTVSKDVNKYFAPMRDIKTIYNPYNWNHTGNGRPSNASLDGENGYVTFYHDAINHRKNAASQFIFSRLKFTEDNVRSVDVGSAKFYVVKLRIRGYSNVSYITLQLGTKYSVSSGKTDGNIASIELNEASYLKDNEWCTLIIPIDELMSKGWESNDNGTYTVSHHQYTIGFKSADVTTYVDLGYIAFVDTLDEAVSVVDTDTYGLMTGNNTCTEYNTASDN